MKHSKKYLAGLALMLMLPGLSGCGLLPAEKQVVRVPLVREYTAPEYSLAYVQRGPFSVTETVSCRYMPVCDSMLSFGVSGVYYDAVYVQEGDSVREGDLLATLVMGDLPQQIVNAQNTLAELKLKREQILQQQTLAIRQQQTLLGSLAAGRREGLETVPEVQARYDQLLSANADAIYLQQLQIEALEQRRAQREIRADMNGTVTYIRRIKDGDRSVEGASFLRIADMTHSVFMASTNRWEMFVPGDYVTITSGRVEYEAVVTDAETLSLEAVTDPESNKRNVYFSLTAPAPELEDGDTGSTILVLEHRDDTLCLDKKAVHTVNGQHVVYYQDPQTGIRTFKTVETGLETARQIEILSGLQEGESVILK
ncbi:MAG TPA: hypothetical protein PKE04_18350 [Clostridia bacterium]|nr:hypothetical protein [Clostridia bacterium]